VYNHNPANSTCLRRAKKLAFNHKNLRTLYLHPVIHIEVMSPWH
jgi:hypothetical protein